ncbi:MAG: S58 family peptidase, partial [Flavisolibacter sp.]|nr:S58 family peptidase [Flavisolibacter sp.]
MRYLLCALLLIGCSTVQSQNNNRLDKMNISIGILPRGQWNAITDVEGVKVGQVSLIRHDS